MSLRHGSSTNDVESMVDVTRPLDCRQARKLLRPILGEGRFVYTSHARQEMENDDLGFNDVVNVLRAGQIREPPELVKGAWRHRVHTDRICVVVAFRSEAELVVVTAWRKQP